MLSNKEREKLVRARARAESKGNHNSAAHKILKQNPIKKKEKSHGK